MKIAEVVATFPPEYTGIGNVCYNNSMQLAKLGNNVLVFTTEPTWNNSSLPITSLQTIRLKPLVRFGNAPVLPDLMKINDVDIIHLHLPFFFGSEIIYTLHKLRGIPYVVTYHHDPILKFPLNIISASYNCALSKIIDDAKAIFVSSIDYAYNCRLRKKFLRNKRLRELPIGVDIARFNPSLNHKLMRKKLGIEDTETVILFVGVLDRPHYFKGLQYLLLAFSKLNQRNCRLIIVGEGELKSKFIQLVNKLGVDRQTIFLGRVSDELLPYLYASSDFLVLPAYTMSEAFGKVLLEAMACGKPVIASNLPGVRSVISPWKDGLYVKPADVEDLYCKMRYLIDDPNLKKKFGANGRKKVESNYSWDNVGQRLGAFIEEMI